MLIEKNAKRLSGQTQEHALEESVRQRTIEQLKALGWKEGRLRWKPEW